MVLNRLLAFIYAVAGVRRSDDDGGGRAKEAAGYAAAVPVSECLRLQEGEMCCVCLSSMEEGEERRVLPCMHEFHRGCVDRWVSSCRKNCPICRFSMGEEDMVQFHRREAFTDEMLIWFSSFHIAGF
ncbi:hypothetical protein HRI_002303300 [Hibiscus trionum]|uniref:RING-type E3 ubiquitin transferase n=1 Tax=Hibiscus trionum TaxID=183268 RepID=A0A9W7HXN2_HIBTR|nr:hypothetical protein HRI_002303300 [Hibiscus trionum]